MNKKEEIQKLNQEIRNCQKCPLAKVRRNAVPGEGPIDAKIMVVGQAPGREEDKVGRPFIGRAGQFLNELLRIAKIKREKIYITSPIKCFPPNNRPPKKSEIKACFPYLKKQIGIINPKFFILLGKTAIDTLLGGGKLEKIHGKLVKKNGKFYFLTYHPAAAMRFLKIKKLIEKDFRKLSKVLDNSSLK